MAERGLQVIIYPLAEQDLDEILFPYLALTTEKIDQSIRIKHIHQSFSLE